MKTVLMHDWLTGFRGGERVLEVLCEMFPQSPLYTLLHKKGSIPASIEERKIVTSYLQNIPGIHQHYRKFLPLFPSAIQAMDIDEDCELMLSTSHCVIKGLRKPNPRTKHICYIHSPMRYLYDQYEHYFGENAPTYQRIGARVFRDYLTKWDIASNKNVDTFVANSHFVGERVVKYYKRRSLVVHPFVDLDDIGSKVYKKEDYYVVLSAFAPNKKVDLAIKAFNKLGKRLIVMGSGQQEKQLRQLAGPTIEFKGFISRNELIETLGKGRALIFPGIEDFGIVPLEALALGTPVVAFKKGGILETQTEQTAEFFDEQSSKSLGEAVKRFESRESSFSYEICHARAREFNKEKYQREMRKVIEEVMR